MAGVLSRTNDGRTLVQAQPHHWALSFWGRTFRQFARPWVVDRHIQRFCRPLEVVGQEHLSAIDTSALIIANHTSHFDTLIVLSILPTGLFRRTAVAAAADRFYTERRKGAWYSLRYNAFPITRHGGKAALAYSEWLLQNDWSLLIFPEGTRSRSGELLPFHAGPAMLALKQRVPVLPISIRGASNILRPGTRMSRPARVGVRVGPPLAFGEDETVAGATAKMEAAMHALAGEQPAAQAPRGVMVG